MKKTALEILCTKHGIDLACLRRRIINYEKFSASPYWDNGHLTVGYGTTLSCLNWFKYICSPTTFKISKKGAKKHLDKYIYSAAKFLTKFLGVNVSLVNHVRKEALIDMIFNMGCSRFRGFKNMCAALKATRINWETVSREAKDSDYWRKKNKIDREENVVKELLTGEYAKVY